MPDSSFMLKHAKYTCGYIGYQIDVQPQSQRLTNINYIHVHYSAQITHKRRHATILLYSTSNLCIYTHIHIYPNGLVNERLTCNLQVASNNLNNHVMYPPFSFYFRRSLKPLTICVFVLEYVSQQVALRTSPVGVPALPRTKNEPPDNDERRAIPRTHLSKANHEFTLGTCAGARALLCCACPAVFNFILKFTVPPCFILNLIAR